MRKMGISWLYNEIPGFLFYQKLPQINVMQQDTRWHEQYTVAASYAMDKSRFKF